MWLAWTQGRHEVLILLLLNLGAMVVEVEYTEGKEAKELVIDKADFWGGGWFTEIKVERVETALFGGR